jgi:hypothetical protein
MAGDDAEVRRVGVRDVARLAGVSSQTVSRVINEHPNIRPETRAKVLDAMAALDYRVNNAARALGTRTTRTLGVIASDAALYGPAVGIAALEAAARAAGRWVATTYADAGDESSVTDAARHLLAQGVDGVIAVAPHARTLDILAAAGVPVVALHGGIGAQRQAEGAALAVAHLADLGHRRIARIAGPADWPEALARDGGVDDALAARALERGERWAGDWSAADRPGSWPRTTRWRSGSSQACGMPVSTFHVKSAWWASTTIRTPRSIALLSPPSGSTSPARPGGLSRHWSATTMVWPRCRRRWWFAAPQGHLHREGVAGLLKQARPRRRGPADSAVPQKLECR